MGPKCGIPTTQAYRNIGKGRDFNLGTFIWMMILTNLNIVHQAAGKSWAMASRDPGFPGGADQRQPATTGGGLLSGSVAHLVRSHDLPHEPVPVSAWGLGPWEPVFRKGPLNWLMVINA